MLVYSFLMFHLISSLMSGPKHRTVNRSCCVSKYKSFFLTPSKWTCSVYKQLFFFLKIKITTALYIGTDFTPTTHICRDCFIIYHARVLSQSEASLHVFYTKAAKLNYISTLFLMETLFRLINGVYLHEGDLIWETRR